MVRESKVHSIFYLIYLFMYLFVKESLAGWKGYKGLSGGEGGRGSWALREADFNRPHT